MVAPFERSWEGIEWQVFSHRLVQLRHGPQNVQAVPDHVQGDAGIECFALDGTCYQSYAPEEVSDTKKAASAMKSKASRDLGKLKKNEATILKLLGDIRITRWILLCPFLDDKDVIAFTKQKARTLATAGCAVLDASFEALVHCPNDFQTEIAQLRHLSVGAPIQMVDPEESDIDERITTLDQTLDEKLERGFGDRPLDQRQRQKRSIIRSSLLSENLLEQMKTETPELWDRATRSIFSVENRLAMGGGQYGNPSELIDREIICLSDVLQKALPSLNPIDISVIATGQIGSWLIQCPLDFNQTAAQSRV